MAAPGPPDPGAVATAACPVPPAQRPLEQYRELAASWFFAWPHASFASLLRPLAVSWLLLLPGAWLVASGSVALRHDPPRLVAAGAVAALVLPLLLLTRQWLGWTSIQRRLVATAVEYEESGWYDGQVWEKPWPGGSRTCWWPPTRCGRCWMPAAGPGDRLRTPPGRGEPLSGSLS